jgi:hypothetical protein
MRNFSVRKNILFLIYFDFAGRQLNFHFPLRSMTVRGACAVFPMLLGSVSRPLSELNQNDAPDQVQCEEQDPEG